MTSRERHVAYRYGLSPEQYSKLLSDQEGECAGCSAVFGPDCLPHVDHCHTTQAVRGILCHSCNSCLGSFKDNRENLLSAARFLDAPPGLREKAPVADLSALNEVCLAYQMLPVDLPCGLLGARRDNTLLVVLDPTQHNARLMVTRDHLSPQAVGGWLSKWQTAELEREPGLEILLVRSSQMGAGLRSLLDARFTPPERLHARDMEVKKVSQEDAGVFLDLHHLQGKCNAPCHLGLYTSEGKLVSLMSFNRLGAVQRRPNQVPAEGYLLQRFCSAGRVRGGASKLLAAFRAQEPGAITTYSDPAYTAGGLYAKLGFTKGAQGGNDYVYWKDGRFHAKGTKQKGALQGELQARGIQFSLMATERTLAELAGYESVYLPGKIPWYLPALPLPAYVPSSVPPTP